MISTHRQIKLGYSGNYVHVTTQPKGCYAYVGNINRGAQELNLQDDGCFSSRYVSYIYYVPVSSFLTSFYSAPSFMNLSMPLEPSMSIAVMTETNMFPSTGPTSKEVKNTTSRNMPTLQPLVFHTIP